MSDFKLKPEQAKAIAILAVVAVALYFGVQILTKTFGSLESIFSKLGSTLGITKSPAAVAATNILNTQDAASITSASPWNPNFFSSNPGATIMTQASGDAIAAQIWDSVGIFTTSPSEMQGAIESCSTQAQVSFVAWRFNQNYGKDLWTWLRLQFNSNTQLTVLQQAAQYVDGLPNS